MFPKGPGGTLVSWNKARNMFDKNVDTIREPNYSSVQSIASHSKVRGENHSVQMKIHRFVQKNLPSIAAPAKFLVPMLLVGGMSYSQAAILLSEDWSSVTTPSPASPASSLVVDSTTYYAGGEAAGSGVQVVNVSSGVNALQVTGNTTGLRYVKIPFDAVNLTNVGDYVSFTGDIRFTTAPANLAHTLRLGFYNLADITVNPPATSTGYWLALNPGGTSSQPVRDNTSSSFLSFTGSPTTPGNQSRSENFGTNFTEVTMTLTRIASDGMQFSYKVGSAASISYNFDSTAPGNTFAFNSFVVGITNTATSETNDQFQLGSFEVTAVPEPSSAVLLGAGALALALLRRKSLRS